MSKNLTDIIERKCLVSPMYGRDEFKQLHFYCDYCGEEMGYEEVRVCKSEIEMCECGHQIGNSDKSVSTCLNCNKEI